MVLCVIRMDAAILKLDGDLTWEITEPRLTFKMVGGLQNSSPAGTTSGTIKLVLWANKTPYPSVGSIVGEYNLGQIAGGYQFSDFAVKTNSNVPTVTGDYYFTIAVLEYTTAGWINRLVVETGKHSLLSGNFTDQLKWTIPTAKVLAPVPALATGQRLKLTLKGSEYLNLFPTESQTVTTVDPITLSQEQMAGIIAAVQAGGISASVPITTTTPGSNCFVSVYSTFIILSSPSAAHIASDGFSGPAQFPQNPVNFTPSLFSNSCFTFSLHTTILVTSASTKEVT